MPRKFACELCGQEFIHGTHYRRHMKLHEDNPGKALTPRASRSANGSNKKTSKVPKKASHTAPQFEPISIVPIEDEPSTSQQPAPGFPLFHLQDHQQIAYEAHLEHSFNYKSFGTFHPNNMLNN